jgi:hypothetical protein
MSVWISVSRAWGAVSSGNGREFDAFDEDELLDVLVDYHTGGDRVPDDAPPLWLRAGHHILRSAADGGFWDTSGWCAQVSGLRLAFRRVKP